MEDVQDSTFSGPSALSIAKELKDDTYVSLVNDFFGSQTGHLLDLDEKPCRNRMLVQVGLMREENNISWEVVEKWLQKIFPMFQTADFHGLIDWNTETAMSLTGAARESFLQTNVNFDFVGPICDSIGIGRMDLLEMSDFSDRARLLDVTNGLILELTNFVEREKIDPVVLVSWLRNFDPSFCSDGKIQRANKLLQVNLNRFRIQYRNNQRSRNRSSGLYDEFLQSPFDLSPDLDDSEFRRVSMKKGHFKRKRQQLAQSTSCYKSKRIKMEGKPFDSSPGYSRRRFVKDEEVPQNNPSETVSEQALQEDSRVDTGDCLTLLDISIMSLQKLTSIYGGICKDAKVVSRDLLSNHFSLMLQKDSDLSTMSEKVLAHASDENPQLAPPVYFLQCNALFFFNLTSALEKQIMSFEKEIEASTGEEIGRNKNPKFQSFLNFEESVVTRYVTMACEILCPRKETCRGYRRHWLAFCVERKNPSRLPVNQSNRFINYFEAAAGLLHHYQDVALFVSDLQQLNDDSNIFLDSVNSDANDEVVQALVCVVALVYCKVLGPFWQLLKSDEQYSSFNKHVFKLYQKLLSWSRCDAGLLKPDLKANVFLQEPIQQKNFSGIFKFCQAHEENQYGKLMKACLKKLMVVSASVMEENFKDFLPGGKYSEGPSQELAEELASCTFSQLMGEYPFGHDYHYKNKKPDKVQAKADASLETDLTPGPGGCVRKRKYRSKFRMFGKAHLLNEGQQKRIKLIDKQQRVQVQEQVRRKAIITAISDQGGPCKSREDVDQLLARIEGAHPTKKREAIRCQLNYQKFVVGCKDRRLKRLGFCLADMVLKLKSILPGENS